MLKLYDQTFNARLLLGTALYPSPKVMQDAIRASGADIITVSLRRETAGGKTGDAFWSLIRELGVTVLPNTAGCRTALIKDGFEVLPYTTEDLGTAMRLVEVGCRVVMPWASPIGSARGITNRAALKLLRQRLPDITLIVDAGLGAPSHAAEALELGYDGVLLNTAVAKAADPVAMAGAFKLAVNAGRAAFEAGLMGARDFASPSSPVVGTPFWHAVS
jgi:thiazole synthase